MLTLSLGLRPANPAMRPSDVINCRAPNISALERARSFLRAGNPAGYARVLAGEHRSHSGQQQRAIEAAIVSDGPRGYSRDMPAMAACSRWRADMDHTLNSAVIEAGLRAYMAEYRSISVNGAPDEVVEESAGRGWDLLSRAVALPNTPRFLPLRAMAIGAFVGGTDDLAALNGELVDGLGETDVGKLMRQVLVCVAKPPAPTASVSPDAALLEAWEQYKASALAIELTGLDDDDPGREALNAALEMAEQRVFDCPAATIPGLLVKQRMALDIAAPDAWVQRALFAGDDSTLIARKAEFNLEERLIVGTIEGLLLAEAAAITPPTDFRVAHDRYIAARTTFDATRGNETVPAWVNAQQEWLDAAETMDAMRPTSWVEFADALMVACDQGESALSEPRLELLVADIKRLRAQSPGLSAEPATEPHMAMLATYLADRERLAATSEGSEEHEALISQVNRTEAAVIKTAASTPDAVVAKLCMAVRVSADGAGIGTDQALAILSEAEAAFGIASLARAA